MDQDASTFVMDVYTSQYEKVQSMLESSIDPNTCDQNGYPAIIAATTRLDIKMLQLLLKHGANPNLYTSDKRSALKTAAFLSAGKIVSVLLEHGADPNYEKDGEVALTLALDPHFYFNKDVKVSKTTIRALLPVTDSRYYQKAYERAFNPEIRQMIKDHVLSTCPDLKLTEPSDGFGGPNYRQHQIDIQPPTGDISSKVWKYILYILKTFEDIDPNDFWLFYDFQKMLQDEPNLSWDDIRKHRRILRLLDYASHSDTENGLPEEYQEVAKLIHLYAQG